MIFLAITAAELNDALQTACASDAIWCGADAISESDYAVMAPTNLIRFVYERMRPANSS